MMKPIFSKFIPIAPSGGQGSQKRQRYIQKYRMFLPLEDCPPSNTEIMIYVEFHYKTDNIKDIDNSQKSLFDALKTKIFHDDRQIVEVHAKIIKWSERAGINLKVFEKIKEEIL